MSDFVPSDDENSGGFVPMPMAEFDAASAPVNVLHFPARPGAAASAVSASSVNIPAKPAATLAVDAAQAAAFRARALGANAPPAAGVGTLQPGATGADVTLLQSQLAAWGFAAGAADGSYGPNTTDAVKALQRKLGVDVDGVFGPATKKAALADLQLGANSVIRANQQMMGLTSPPAVPVNPEGTALAIPQAAQGPMAVPAFLRSPLFWGIGAAVVGAWLLFRPKPYTELAKGSVSGDEEEGEGEQDEGDGGEDSDDDGSEDGEGDDE